MHPSLEEIKEAAKIAVKTVFSSLKNHHPETFYYVVLTTSGEASPPSFSAWSHEALAAEAAKRLGEDVKNIKWSYGESPYFCYLEDEFDEIARLFGLRPPMITSMSEEKWYEEYEFRLKALEFAMAELDHDGLFGAGEQRKQIVINVEVMPPDWTNTARAMRLNPPESLVEWLAENDQS